MVKTNLKTGFKAREESAGTIGLDTALADSKSKPTIVTHQKAVQM